MTIEPLPPTGDERFGWLLQDWMNGHYSLERWPRTAWLHDFEAILREHYPHASSDQLTLTARLAAPFPLALPGVP